MSEQDRTSELPAVDAVGSRREVRRFRVWLVAVTLLAAALRLYHLDAASFWRDELRTIEASPNPWRAHKSKVLGYVPTALGLALSGVETSAVDSFAPETWREMGIAERSARLPACLIGIATIPLLGLVARPLLGVRATAIVTLLLAIAPWHIYWSQAARFYSQQFLFYNLGFVCYFRATESASRWRLAGAMTFLVLAFLSQPTALVIAAVLAGDWIIALLRKKPVRLGPAGWGMVVAAAVICVGVLLYDVYRAPASWSHFAEARRHGPITLTAGTMYLMNIPVALFGLMVTPWLIAKRGRLGAYLALGALGPLVTFVLLSFPLYVGTRYVFVCLFSWLAVAAVGAEAAYGALRPHFGRAFAWAPLGLLVVSMALMDLTYYTRGFGFHPRWKDALAYVAEHREITDTVCAELPVGNYYLEDAGVRLLPRTADDLRRLDRRVWMVYDFEKVGKSWVDDVAQLKACFDLYVLEPRSSLRVYFYDPDYSD